jgi:hypothetical protein
MGWPEPGSGQMLQEFRTDYGQLRSNVARSSCVQVVYKKAGLKGLKMDLSNAESTTDS